MPANRGLWRVPDIWKGGECFILGGGPSLDKETVARLKGRRVIAVNSSFMLADWIDVMYFGDCAWLKSYGYPNGILEWAGLKVTTCEAHAKRDWIRVVKRKNGPHGLSTNPNYLWWNLSSGACAINLAFLFGVKRIVLLGYDMQKVDGANNWHGVYRKAGQKAGHDPYAKFLKRFPAINDTLKVHGVECLNATPNTALHEFRNVSLEEVL